MMIVNLLNLMLVLLTFVQKVFFFFFSFLCENISSISLFLSLLLPHRTTEIQIGNTNRLIKFLSHIGTVTQLKSIAETHAQKLPQKCVNLKRAFAVFEVLKKFEFEGLKRGTGKSLLVLGEEVDFGLVGGLVCGPLADFVKFFAEVERERERERKSQRGIGMLF